MIEFTSHCALGFLEVNPDSDPVDALLYFDIGQRSKPMAGYPSIDLVGNDVSLVEFQDSIVLTCSSNATKSDQQLLASRTKLDWYVGSWDENGFLFGLKSDLLLALEMMECMHDSIKSGDAYLAIRQSQLTLDKSLVLIIGSRTNQRDLRQTEHLRMTPPTHH